MSSDIEPDSEIDAIIDELRGSSVPAVPNRNASMPESKESVTDDNVGEYVYKKSAALVESTLGAVEAMKDTVLAGSDPREIAALSQLINSATKALDQLNKINIQNKQAKTAIETKKMELAANSGKPTLGNTTNVLIATRDEIMSKLFDEKPSKKEKLEILDVEYTKDSE